ncbi:hypothetical protein EVC45_45330, partial [Paraburkholderia sp. UYCP14C]
MEAQHVAMALGALAKWPDEVDARNGALRLAGRVASEARLRESMNAQAVASALNALAKWPDEDDARNGALRLAGRVASEA